MKKLSEVCKITGLSRRALQGYDQMGLLSPTAKTEAGYWLYDDEAIKKLIVIKIFTEAGYTREHVKELLDAPVINLANEYDLLVSALREEQRHIEGIIRTIRLFKIESQLSDSARTALQEIDSLVAYGQRDFSTCFGSLVSEASKLDSELDAHEMEMFMLFWYSLIVGKRQNHRVAKQENSWRRLESSRSFLVFARNAPRVLRAGAAIP